MKRMSLFVLLGFAFILSCDKNEGPSLPVLSIPDIEITESDENSIAQVGIQLSEISDVEISVNAFTFAGSANENDYIPVDTTLIFQPGSTQLSFEIVIIGDEILEGDEFFQIIMSNPVNAELESDRGTITIRNDDVHEFNIPDGYTSAESYAGKTLVWEENFDEIDTDIWKFDNGDGCPDLCGWGNEELQYYASENASIVEGNLVIEARKESRGGKAYTSAKLISKDTKTFKFGRIDIRAVMPFGKGFWPALWMLGNNIDEVGWPSCGEIDIMEMVGGGDSDSETYGTVHWSNGNSYANFGGSKKLESGKLSDEFHVYSIEWDESFIRWFLDDEQYHAIDITSSDLSEFREEFYFILNVAVGGNWPGAPDNDTLFPNWMIVDYIRVFQ